MESETGNELRRNRLYLRRDAVFPPNVPNGPVIDPAGAEAPCDNTPGPNTALDNTASPPILDSHAGRTTTRSGRNVRKPDKLDL